MKKANLFRLSLLAIILVVFLASYKLYAIVSPQKNNKCSKCHTEVSNNSLSQMYIHQPVMDENCVVCHQKELAKIRKSNNRNADRKKAQLPKGAKLFARNSVPATSKWFQIPYNEVGNEVFVKVHSGRIRDIKKIDISAHGKLSSLENDWTPPTISDVKTTIQKGIFITAKVTWKTDKPTKSLVSYGMGTKMKDAPKENNFSRTHEVELAALKKNTQYQFIIHSTDLFDKSVSSDMLTFSTENPQSAIRDTQAAARRERKELKMTKEIFRSDDNLVFHLRSNQPATMAMYLPRVIKTSKFEDPELQGEHTHFRSELDINNTICSSCHKGIKKTQSHPVNVFPKPGMTIPREYPTLPDGRITCNTCHSRHASNNKFRTIRDNAKELCVGCHKNYG